MSTRLFSLLLAVCALFVSITAQAQKTDAPATAPAAKAPAPASKAPVTVDPFSQAIGEAMAKMDANDLDGAIAKLTDAINLDPKKSAPYVFRASVYFQKKMWPQAEADFKTASKLDPKNIVIQFNIPEVKFVQKQYDAARPGYLALKDDPQMGDLAAYKVFLCDLLAGHEALAQKERDAFNTVNTKPSYYFSNAAWELVHKNNEKAQSWLVSVANIYPSAKISYYALPLKDLGYLPIPAPSSMPSATGI